MTNTTFRLVNFFSTNDYSLFNFFDFNRDVDKNHVNTLKESISKRGFSGAILVIYTDFKKKGDFKYYILDGQHRFTAAKELGIEFTFEIVTIEGRIELAKFIADVNNSSKAWGTNQFLNVWANMEIQEYIKLKSINSATGIQITPLIEAYTGQSSMRDFRKGEMKFINEEDSDIIIAQIMELNKYLPTKAFCRRSIIRIMRRKDYNHQTIKHLIIRYALERGFTENEKEMRDELIKLIQVSKRVPKLVA